MPTLDEMVAINRTAEMIAHMGIRPPGPEAYAYATQLLGLVKSIQAECRVKWPHLVGNINAGNIITLQRLDVQTEVVNAAKALVEAIDGDPNAIDIHATKQLIASVHVHNLVTEMPTVPSDTDKEQIQ